jgi:hypothetical protein
MSAFLPVALILAVLVLHVLYNPSSILLVFTLCGAAYYFIHFHSYQVLNMTLPLLVEGKFRSSEHTTVSIAKKYKMDEKLMLEPWADLNEDVLKCIGTLPKMWLSRAYVPAEAIVCNGEFNVQAQADSTVFKSLNILFNTLCSHPRFSYLKEGQFSDISGCKIFCDPDRIWVTEDYKLAKLTVEFKTPWAFDFGDVNIITHCNEEYAYTLQRGVRYLEEISTATSEKGQSCARDRADACLYGNQQTPVRMSHYI